MMIERECSSDAGALHDGETGRVDRGELVQISAAKIFPRRLRVQRIA